MRYLIFIIVLHLIFCRTEAIPVTHDQEFIEILSFEKQRWMQMYNSIYWCHFIYWWWYVYSVLFYRKIYLKTLCPTFLKVLLCLRYYFIHLATLCTDTYKSYHNYFLSVHRKKWVTQAILTFSCIFMISVYLSKHINIKV